MNKKIADELRTKHKALLLALLIETYGPNWLACDYQLVFAEVRQSWGDDFPDYGADLELEVVAEAKSRVAVPAVPIVRQVTNADLDSWAAERPAWLAWKTKGEAMRQRKANEAELVAWLQEGKALLDKATDERQRAGRKATPNSPCSDKTRPTA